MCRWYVLDLLFVLSWQYIATYYFLNNINKGDKSWMFHKVNVQAHIALSDMMFLAKYKIPVLYHPPYLQDLASCDIPKIKSALKRTRFQILEDMKKSGTRHEKVHKRRLPALFQTIENSHGEL